MSGGGDKQVITEAAHRYGIDPKVLWGLYGEESSFGRNPSTSSAGAVGPFQFLPSTAKGMGVDPNNFKSAAFGAAKYLSQYKGRGVGGMLSAYNAGPAGAYQPGYVKGVEGYAKSYGSEPRGAGVVPEAPLPLPKAPAAQTASAPTAAGGFDQAGFDKAQKASILGRLIQEGGGRKENPLFATGLVTTKAPNRAEFTTTTPPPSAAVPQAAAPSLPGVPGSAPGGKLGGFLPGNAELQIKRIDAGQDLKTNAGGPIVAPGDGFVVAVKSDPGGFGPDYPVVKFTSGPMAGTSWYLGHTHSALRQGDHFKAGQTLSHTGTGRVPVGNATEAGWAELGLSSALGQGDQGQGRATERYLKGRR